MKKVVLNLFAVAASTACWTSAQNGVAAAGAAKFALRVDSDAGRTRFFQGEPIHLVICLSDLAQAGRRVACDLGAANGSADSWSLRARAMPTSSVERTDGRSRGWIRAGVGGSTRPRKRAAARQ